jgi:hypothetical protein
MRLAKSNHSLIGLPAWLSGGKMDEMEKNQSRILVIVSDRTFSKLRHATTESREKGEVRC